MAHAGAQRSQLGWAVFDPSAGAVFGTCVKCVSAKGFLHWVCAQLGQFEFADATFSATFDNFSDTVKLRKAGFEGQVSLKTLILPLTPSHTPNPACLTQSLQAPVEMLPTRPSSACL